MTTASTASVTTHSPFPAPARPHPVLTVLLLTLVTVVAYWHVGDAGFATHEDDAYLVHQPLVNQGLSPAGIVWAFTGSHSGNWHPLTTLTHMIDCEVFGLRPAPMHWENVVWHVLNAALVFLVWRALTGATWRPAIVAALFALHPLNVESVAWISQRKEVLSAFFSLIGIGAYIGYARHRSIRRYLLVVGALLLALWSKPMALTFPFTLLLLDFWPLRRWPLASWRVLIIEKLPLFGLVAFHSVLSFLVQHASASYAEPVPFAARLGNAVVAYVRYLGKTFWPESLAPMYFPPDIRPAGIVAGAAVALVAASVAIWWLRRTRPWLTFGWLWFLGTLVPVIGLFQVGAESMADRYMYVPILGLFTLIVWQFSRLVYLWPPVRGPLCVATVALLLGFGLLTTRQVTAWKNRIALQQQAGRRHSWGLQPPTGGSDQAIRLEDSRDSRAIRHRVAGDSSAIRR